MTYSAVKVTMFWMLLSALKSEEQNFVFHYWGDARLCLMQEIFLCAAAWCVSIIVDCWNYATVRANLQAQASSTSEGTVKALLVVLCDAVVTVDMDLAFCTHGMEIASFLVRRPLNNSYEGTSLLDLVEEDDRHRVREQITAALMGHGTTLSLSTRLIDGNGNALSVQMYCTCFVDINDCRCYVIGILELKDAMYGNQRQDTLAVDYLDDTMNGIRGSGALHSVSEADRDSFKSEGESVTVPLCTDAEEVEFWIDIAEGSLPVVNANLVAATIVGPLSSTIGASFMDWLRQSDSAEVVRLIAGGWDRFVASPRHTKADLGWWHLRPPHALRAGLEYKARMTLDMSRVVRNDLLGAQICVCIRCYDIGVQTLRRKLKKTVRSRSLLCGGETQRMSPAAAPSNDDKQDRYVQVIL
eukprot:TRINITY_DN50963_c0_g1_i2.p1 TRINITY_DN50963_c0_g1~~TRINITY_DN50963_c0_g1_i2.p1  ORF type:complete len:479 (-),score=96.39 TRINITY_DN50963_c0_g1_i2:113-1351(-)